MLAGFTFYIAVVNLPQRFQIVDHNSPVIAGVKLLPMMVSSAVGSLTAGALNSKRNLTMYTLIVASAFQILGYGLMITLGDASPTPSKQYGFQVFLGLGFGMTMPAVTIVGQLHPERKWIRKSEIAFQFLCSSQWYFQLSRKAPSRNYALSAAASVSPSA